MENNFKPIIPEKDEEFDLIIPPQLRKLASRHFTSLAVAKKVAEWFNETDRRLNVLDIGCGVGKFCVAAAYYTDHHITGVDFREDFILVAKGIRDRLGIKNLDFVNQNILDVDFKKFDAFYLFNPFLEQIDRTARLDEKYETSPLLYSIYENHVRSELQSMPEGTLIATYYVSPQQIPYNYELLKMHLDGYLKLWKKKE